MQTITEEVLMSGSSNNGGWNKEQLAAIGVKWPPYKGWKQDVIGKQIEQLALDTFLTRRGLTQSGKFRKNFKPNLTT